MNKTQILENIRETRIIPVVRTKSHDEAKGVIEAILAGGINVLEITMTTPNAIGLMTECVKKYGDKVIVGAGTVVDLETAKNCFDAGVQFIVSPMFDEETVKFCNQNEIIIMPGALTPTEIFNAHKKGADVVKVFPVSSMGGVPHLKAIKSVYPNIEIVPTGGVNLENFDEYLNAGAFAVGIGSDLTGASANQIAERCRTLSNRAQPAIG
ncbi:MAG: bifunctional 4-hydroxy-2-oxoglutarate aldolase/2-dehydro-3-deoxy-phosphogluconate aldolase [Pyrinomonadaceae bacterium]|nr:bifunctional 4-hydroxy-2-oxoglutarate aldolase/2-dehydro-3-deoxy-phosphogluconate aldolase [Pyrinomonadaceae bacterium]